MSAIDTALRVIEWADASWLETAPPRGDAQNVEHLARPDSRLTDALGRLTAAATARLRFPARPMRDDRSLSAGPLLMAAAIGVSGTPKLARLLLREMPLQCSAIDAVALHGLAWPALRYLQVDVAEDCRLVSPFTAVLDRPCRGQEGSAISTITRMLEHTSERRSLTLHLACPANSTPVRDWQYSIMDRLRLGSPNLRTFVLDVYETMLIYHREEILGQMEEARSVLTGCGSSSDDAQLEDARSVAVWWAPLWCLEREDPDALRSRVYLDYSYRDGLKLYLLYRRLSGRGG